MRSTLLEIHSLFGKEKDTRARSGTAFVKQATAKEIEEASRRASASRFSPKEVSGELYEGMMKREFKVTFLGPSQYYLDVEGDKARAALEAIIEKLTARIPS